MRTEPLPRHREMSQIAERQMRTWALQLQSQQRLAEQKEATGVQKLIQPYVAISRETGADGEELANQVAQKLGWKTLDRELLDYMAERYNLSRITLEFVDETVASWFHEMFGKWLDEQMVSQAEYVHRLGRLVLLAAQHESTVFVGRGVQFMLPSESGITVRVIAPKKWRIERIMQVRHCDRQQAEKYIEETDRGREQFVERYFHHDTADPHLYDLVINLQNTILRDAADLIVNQCRQRFMLPR